MIPRKLLADALAALAIAEKNLATAKKDAEQARKYANDIEHEVRELRAQHEKVKQTHAQDVIQAIRAGKKLSAAPDFGSTGSRLIDGDGRLESARMAVKWSKCRRGRSAKGRCGSKSES